MARGSVTNAYIHTHTRTHAHPRLLFPTAHACHCGVQALCCARIHQPPVANCSGLTFDRRHLSLTDNVQSSPERQADAGADRLPAWQSPTPAGRGCVFLEAVRQHSPCIQVNGELSPGARWTGCAVRGPVLRMLLSLSQALRSPPCRLCAVFNSVPISCPAGLLGQCKQLSLPPFSACVLISHVHCPSVPLVQHSTPKPADRCCAQAGCKPTAPSSSGERRTAVLHASPAAVSLCLHECWVRATLTPLLALPRQLPTAPGVKASFP